MGIAKVLTVPLKNKPEHNVIIGQAHFIKTVEDVHELVVNSVPGAQFGLAFCEASGPRLIRTSGTSKSLEADALRMAKLIGAGHVFVLVLDNLYPINVLPKLSSVPEIVTLFCASSNPLEVAVAESRQGRGVLGVIDGGPPAGAEGIKEKRQRQRLLRQIGYKM